MFVEEAKRLVGRPKGLFEGTKERIQEVKGLLEM